MNTSAIVSHPQYHIRTATPADLAIAKAWLQKEKDELGQSFICNWDNAIMPSHESGNVSVCVETSSDLAVALTSFTRNNFDIMVVRPDLRKAGIGTFLARHCLWAAQQLGSFGMTGLCAPSNSYSFWEKMGFRKYNPHVADAASDDIHIVRFFEHSRQLPDASDKVSLRIELSSDQLDIGDYQIYDTREIKAGILSEYGADRYLLEKDFVSLIKGPRWKFKVFVRNGTDLEQVYEACWTDPSEEISGFTQRPFIRIRQIPCI